MLGTGKFKAVIAVTVLLFASLVAFGCGDSGPKGSVESFINAFKDKNCEKAVDYIDLEGAGTNKEDMVKSCQASVGAGEIVSYKILEENINGDKATVKVETTTKIGDKEETTTDTIDVVKKNGEWKVSLGGSSGQSDQSGQ
jgi:hypothetical protein